MTPPRYIAPNAVYAICRRTERRRFLLRPDPVLDGLFRWLLAVCATRFGVEVHAATCMSTHFHLVVTVPHENVSAFMHAFDTHLAKAVKVLRPLADGVVWEPGGLSIVELETPEAVIEQIAYAMANPVAAGAVYRPEDWPGVTVGLEELGRGELRGARPAFYFADPEWPGEASVELTWPAWLRAMGEDEARRQVAAELEGRVAEARAEIAATGWRVGWKVKARHESPYRCAVGLEERGKLRPSVAAGRGQVEARRAALERLAVFRQRYREAKERWCAGDRDVVFPAGTYWMRVHHGVAVEAFP